MNGEERRRCLWLLRRCREQRDTNAYNELTQRVASGFGYLIRGYGTSDPAFDRDDLRVEFQRGIWQAIDVVDFHKGDPLYHLAYRGHCQVLSLLVAVKRRRCGSPSLIERNGGEPYSVGTIPEGFDLPDEREDSDPGYALQVTEERDEAHEHVVRILADTQLAPRYREALEWMLHDEDPGGPGANLRLARALEVTPQAASQMRERITERVTGHKRQTQLDQLCDRCGRGFGSSGALTQHKRGQSGHAPCPAAVEA